MSINWESFRQISFKTAIYKGLSLEDAEDIAQESCLRLFIHDYPIWNLKGLAYTISSNLVFDKWRRKREKNIFTIEIENKNLSNFDIQPIINIIGNENVEFLYSFYENKHKSGKERIKAFRLRNRLKKELSYSS